ncbi:protein phosphatase 2C domain-containing protein [Kitasatospora sp. NPDC048540]|uniref:protein phosphatase 2C domain-containing protein n=1 Tax=unclassified Kitasatospora TaxID=2633591 RepID=UPI00068B5239|nr:protein phosphatase 2C domain-containing protein [Kitasatospora sp. MBT63]
MSITSASLPGRPDIPNQDLLLTAPGVLVLLDGAGGPSEDGGGCRHGVHWYVRQLGSRLLTGLLTADRPVADLLADAIDAVAHSHRSTCDLRHPGTPSSTVAIVRQRGEDVDHLVLHDSTLLLTRADGSGTETVSDRRLHHIPELHPLRSAAHRCALGTDRHAAARKAYIAAELGHRNAAGGYWVAGSDPRAATHALTGTTPAAALRSVSLLSDGAADHVDTYHLATWPETVALLSLDGPATLLAAVRAAEHSDPRGRRWPRLKPHDDATAAHWTDPAATGAAAELLRPVTVRHR